MALMWKIPAVRSMVERLLWEGSTNNMTVNNLLLADWTETWTLDEAKKELPEFTFKGDGWYLLKSDSMLVELRDYDPKKDAWTYKFSLWNRTNIPHELGEIANRPIQDDRR
jgi:hypothetical protein